MVLIKYSGKYVKIYSNMKITFLVIPIFGGPEATSLWTAFLYFSAFAFWIQFYRCFF